VSDRNLRIAGEWIAGLGESLAVFSALVLQRPVVDAWPSPSKLDGYTVGGIAGHVLSLMVGLQMRIETGKSTSSQWATGTTRRLPAANCTQP
jgi:hypothetical protein